MSVRKILAGIILASALGLPALAALSVSMDMGLAMVDSSTGPFTVTINNNSEAIPF